jgi:carboxyl-terminal processing protease
MKKLFFATSLLLSTSFFASAQSNSAADNNFEISKSLDIYYAIFKDVNEYYVDPIQPGKMLKKSLDEMLRELDPYTNYGTEEELEDFRFQTTGKYGGIGCSMRDLGDYLAFEELLENGPAQKAGLKAGDVLLAIDGKSTKNMNDENVGKLIKGAPGTIVKFTIKNPITNEESVKSITREEINVKNITHSDLIGSGKDIAFVRLSQFTENASGNIKSALDSLKKVKGSLKGVVLDLRFNPGGLLDEAVNVCNLFQPKDQVIVNTKGKNPEWDKTYKTNFGPWDASIPVVVLVNKGSASASEIVSGTLQDLDRAVVIGQKSYGKGLVQSTRNMPFNTRLKVTTAKYYIPSGRCIQALDYSRRNEDGSVGEVPDSLKRAFTTKAGRKVFDGGGIEPDIKTTAREYGKVTSYVLNKNYIFNYATEYASKHPSIASAAEFSLTDNEVQEFFTWLDKKEFSYKSKTTEAIEKLKEIAEKENNFSEIKTQYDALLAIASADKKAMLQKNKDEIKRALQMEIIGRYYYARGRSTNDLQNDDDIKQATAVIYDAAKYNSILKK